MPILIDRSNHSGYLY